MSDSNSPSVNKLLIQTLIRGLEESKNGMTMLQSQIHEINLKYVKIVSQNEVLTKEVHDMAKILKDGNGKAAVVDRLAALEAKVDNLALSIKDKEQLEKEEKKAKRDFYVLYVTTGLTLIIAITSPWWQAFVNLILK